MGILDKLKSKAAGVVAQHMPQQQPTRPTPGMYGTITLEGTHNVQVYTYDGTPFKGMKVGDWFYADVLPGDCILDGPGASEPFDTSGDPYACALCANGVPFGFANLKNVKQIAQAGFAVRVRVEKSGMYSRKLPDLVAFVPSRKVVSKWWTMQQSSPYVIPFDCDSLEEKVAEDQVLAFMIKKSELAGYFGGFGTLVHSFTVRADIWTVGTRSGERVIVHFLPVPDGSHAKPHVAIETEDGSIFEVSARTSYYDDLAALVSEEPYKLYSKAYERNGEMRYAAAIVSE